MRGKKGLWWSEGNLKLEETRLQSSNPEQVCDMELQHLPGTKRRISLDFFKLTEADLLQ